MAAFNRDIESNLLLKYRAHVQTPGLLLCFIGFSEGIIAA